MTTEQLDEIEKLADADMDGPWSEREGGYRAALREYALPLVQAVREARADEKKTRDFYLDRVDELRSEIKRLSSALRLLWEEAQDESRCQVEPGYGHHLSQPCQNAVVAVLSRVTL